MIQNIATLVVKQLVGLGVKHIFCVPGASIDAITTAIEHNSDINLILCRQESNAGLMATAYAKRTGNLAVVLVTAGPGVTNVVTSAATATLEHAPLMVISGQMDSSTTFKPSHQVINAESLLAPVTKYSKEVTNSKTVTSAICLAYSRATTGEKGAVHLAFASDLLGQKVDDLAILPKPAIAKTLSSNDQIQKAADIINKAKYPVIIVGKDASENNISVALNKFIAKSKIAVIATFEAGGLVTRENLDLFAGRIGVFQNQPCTELLQKTDLFITIGYNIAELDPVKWNSTNRPVIHMSEYLPVVATGYVPADLLIGNMALNIDQLTANVETNLSQEYSELKAKIRSKLIARMSDYTKKDNSVHPLAAIKILQDTVKDSDIVISDVGSHQYWMAEYFVSHTPCQFINSMGFQTLGVSLPYAIGASIADSNNRVYSVSGDGGILMCIMELATAVEMNIPLISFIWKDHAYNLVAIQEENKYAETSAVVFENNVCFVKIAEGFGAIGLAVKTEEQLIAAISKAKEYNSPVVIQIDIDYSDNLKRIIQ